MKQVSAHDTGITVINGSYYTLCVSWIDFTELIIRFGPNQNGKDRFVVSTIQTDLEVYCGSGMENISLNWLYPNLTLVSSINYQFRQIKYPNDRNVVLHIARRNVEYCDAGVYVCEAKGMVNGKQITQRRNFTLLVGGTFSCLYLNSIFWSFFVSKRSHI